MSFETLNLFSHLSTAPQKKPLFAKQIKNKQGGDILVADPKATRMMLFLMDQGAVNGGAACHWGGPAAMIDIWSALHAHLFQKKDWFNQYNFVNDIGHAENGIYAIRTNLGFGDLTIESLKGFRSIESKLTGHGESHLYPEGVLLSNGPLSSSLPQAQGLSVADKISGKNRTTIVTISDGACMEGEAKEALSSIPGLASKGKMNPFVLIISDNNTKLGGRIDKDSFSMRPSFETLETLGWKVVKIEEGHNVEKLYQEFEAILSQVEASKPVAVWVKTVKGYGIKSTEESSSGGHGYPLKAHDSKLPTFLQELWGSDDYPEVFKSWSAELMKVSEKTETKTQVKTDKIQVGISEALIEATKKGYPLFSVSSDLSGSTGLKAYQAAYPDRYIDIGIAESNMVSLAVGLSKAGFIPVVDTFAAFGVTKGNLPLIMSSLSEAPVIAIFSHTGFQDAADGASHQSLTYMSALSSIPHLKMVNLACADEARAYLLAAIDDIRVQREKGKIASSYVFFLGRENFPMNFENQKIQFLKPQLLATGSKALIVATGSIVSEAIVAQKALLKDGIDVSLIHHPFVTGGDNQLILDTLINSGKTLVTVEDHQVVGGMGSLLIHELVTKGASFKAKSLGVKGEFGQSSYTAEALYEKHGLTAHWISKAVKEIL